MNQELVQHSYRGVFCHCCRQPIPLPAIVLHIESSLNQSNSALENQKVGRVFTLRCRSCDKEMPYGMANVAVIEGTPKSRVSRVQGWRMRQGELSRAANG
jgi:hypothetical protein